jgi:hypothetical protein
VVENARCDSSALGTQQRFFEMAGYPLKQFSRPCEDFQWHTTRFLGGADARPSSHFVVKKNKLHPIDASRFFVVSTKRK